MCGRGQTALAFLLTMRMEQKAHVVDRYSTGFSGSGDVNSGISFLNLLS
jgi:pyridoxal/pyridoxine/pyridoxamine kinase